MTNDIDRKRIEDTGERARRVIADLEYLAVAGTTQHEKQVDLLKAELEQMSTRLAIAENTIALIPDEPPAVDMTINLDDIRALLAEAGQDNPSVGALLVSDSDDEVQVVDSIHAIVDTLVQRDGLVVALQESRNRAKADLATAIKGHTADWEAAADARAEEQAVLTRKVRDLAVAIRPISPASANLAAKAGTGGALDVITVAVIELATQVTTGGEGATVKALAMARADADRIEDEIHAIEAACEAAGMAATVERRDIPAWLASNLKHRAKTKKPPAEDEPVDDGTVAAHDTKPRGAKVVGIVEAMRLIENDARVLASAELPMAREGGAE